MGEGIINGKRKRIGLKEKWLLLFYPYVFCQEIVWQFGVPDKQNSKKAAL